MKKTLAALLSLILLVSLHFPAYGYDGDYSYPSDPAYIYGGYYN